LGGLVKISAGGGVEEVAVGIDGDGLIDCDLCGPRVSRAEVLSAGVARPDYDTPSEQ